MPELDDLERPEEREAEPSERAAPEEPPTGEDQPDLVDEQADAAEDFMNGLLAAMGIEAEATAEIDEDDTIYLDVEGPEMGVLIGRHGATLEALQELVRAAVQHQTRARARISVDVSGYRERQREMLERKALRLAEKVRRSGRPVELEPMSSFERKVVHTALADQPGVATTSEGEEPERRVVIRPA